jgi:hypothetical protein
MQPWSQPLLWQGGVATPGDPYWSNVVLLMGYEGANNSTGAPGMTDESSHAHGNATPNGSYISTTIAQFGSSSLYVNNPGGTGSSVITFPNSADWQLGSGPFTIEMFVCSDTSIGSFGPFLISLWGASGNFSWVLSVQGQKLCWSVSTTGSNNLSDINGLASLGYYTTIPTTFTHIAIDYDGAKYRTYINGTMDASSTTLRTLFNSTAVLAIGANYNASGNFYGGYIDELRITKGIARYHTDTSFPVPTAAFPRHA